MVVVPSVLTAASVLYIGLAPRINQLLYRQMLFYPVPFGTDVEAVPVLEGIEGEDVYFHGDMGQRLNGWFWRNPEAKFVFLFSHGNSGNITIRDKTARLMLMAGGSVFVYDYQGFGRSTGNPSVEGICSDARGAYDYLVQREGVSPDSIIAYGESLGAAVSSYLTTVRPVRSFVLQSGFASLHRIAYETFPLLRVYPDFLFPKPTLDSQSVLSRRHPPVLLIHGELDSVIPVQHSVDMFNASVGEKRLLKLPNSAHADICQTSPEPYVSALKELIAGF